MADEMKALARLLEEVRKIKATSEVARREDTVKVCAILDALSREAGSMARHVT
jgi:hypothetical protein